jgi:L-fuconolactonase
MDDRLAMKRIDTHQHFWQYSLEEYPWIDDRMPVLRRDFLPDDLLEVLRPAEVDAAISVQARETLAETGWLLEQARANSHIAGVVGWAPLADPGIEGILDELSGDRKLLGLRHILQEEPANQLMESAEFNRGVAGLRRYGLRYDILINERHLGQAIGFVDRHPNQIFILDHLAKPRIADAIREPWAGFIKDLGRRANVYCKISGMVTEANWSGWTAAGLAPYLETALEAFGPRRLMFGSDWPVMLVACPYARWVETVQDWTGKLSPDEQERIWSMTAKEAYNLP